jgi:4-amino-4-deoxy-L-arabinose transferase-like glycosyltransferase
MSNEAENRKLLNKLSAELERLDAQYDDIPAPSLPVMQQFLAAEAIRRRRQGRRELLLFLLAAIFLLSIVLAVFGFAPAVYWVLQAVIPLALLGGLAAAKLRQREEDRRQ